MDDEEKMLGRIRQAATEDGRFPLEAYIFVYQALDYTTHRLIRGGGGAKPPTHEGEQRHVTGKELLEGIRKLAIEAFGPLSLMVFKHWGVRRTEDFGDIVWSLVQRDLMGKTEQDRREDFQDGYSFEEAFSAEKLLRQMNARELAPAARFKPTRELPRSVKITGLAGTS